MSWTCFGEFTGAQISLVSGPDRRDSVLSGEYWLAIETGARYVSFWNVLFCMSIWHVYYSGAYLWPLCIVSSERSLIFTCASQMKTFNLSLNSVSSMSCIFGSFCNEKLGDGTTSISFCQGRLDKIILPGGHFPGPRALKGGNVLMASVYLDRDLSLPCFYTEVIPTVHSETGDKFQSRKHWFHHYCVVEIIKLHTQSAKSQIL